MTTFSITEKSLPTAPLGPDNPLPHFWWQQPGDLMDAPTVGLSEEELENYISMGQPSILPYKVQDTYNRDRHDHPHRVVEIDNGKIKITVLPDLGGRLYSMVDLTAKREMLFCNPVIQPANLSLRNAWFSGGIEWNGSAAPGHGASTCSTVFTHRIDTERGPILRIHDFDRMSETAWQVDLFLPKDEARCYIHGRIVNPNPQPRRVYWWTNATVPYDPDMRIVSPADYSVEHILPDNHLERCEFPENRDFDGSYPENWESATSVFFRKPAQEFPWMSACFADGYGVGQASTAKLRGRKFFFFGNGDGGRRWAEYLSEKDTGQYVEIQSGLMPTQNQLMTVDAKSAVEWTECFAPLAECAAATTGAYSEALILAEQKVTAAIPSDRLAEVDVFLSKVAVKYPTETISRGDGWACLHERMIGVPISQGMNFDADPVDRLWEDLVAGREINADAAIPTLFATSDAFDALLATAISKQPNSGALHLLRGIIMLNNDRLGDAEQLLQEAFNLSASYDAARCLAILKNREGDTNAAQSWYDLARSFEDCPPQVTLELADLLKQLGETAKFENLIETVSEVEAAHERMRILRAEVALSNGDFEQLGKLLNFPFATIREGEIILSDLWKAYVIGKAEGDRNQPLSDSEKTNALRKNPIPFELNFVMQSSETQTAQEESN